MRHLLDVKIVTALFFMSGLMAGNQFTVANENNEIKATTGNQAETSETVLYFASSESMRDSFAGVSKLQAIKRLLHEKSLIAESDTNLPTISVDVYQQGNMQCAGSALAFQNRRKPFDKQSEAFASLNTQGQVSAAEMLQNTVRRYANKDRLHLIYVVGDQDVCNIDVCNYARQLQAKGYRFSVNIISMAVPLENRKPLQCLAQVTGGLFLHARNYNQLKLTYENVVDRIQGGNSDIISYANLEFPRSVSAGERFVVKWQGPANQFDRIVIKSFDESQIFDYSYLFRPLETKANELISSQKTLAPKAKQANLVSLHAPQKDGRYRVHYYTGQKNISLFSQYLEVKKASAKLQPVSPVVAGSEFKVKWSGPKRKYDQIRVVNPNNPSQTYYYTYAKMCADNTARLVAPGIPGNYEIRYLAAEKVLAKIPLVVRAQTVQLEFSPEVMAGSVLQVKWTGPHNQFDKIQLVDESNNQIVKSTYLRMHSGTIVALQTPEKLGHYRVEYLGANERVLVSKALKLIAVQASLKVMSPVVVAGGKVRIHWSGPNNTYDQIKIVNREDASEIYDYSFASFYKTQHMTLNVPEQAGEYEIVYYSQNDKILARTPLLVTQASALIHPIDEPVKAGSNFVISWRGPSNQYDTIEIRANDSKKLDFIYVKMHRSHRARLIAPKQAGEYEILYLTSGKRVLARTQLVVK